MRKRIAPALSVRSAFSEGWLDLEGLAEVEVTSEDPRHPIEAALLPGTGDGWRASDPGPQTVRLIFDNAHDLKLIHLVFVEERSARTHEFVLRWAPAIDGPFTDILRQQYHFTPVASETEDYTVALSGVRVLELQITPAIQGEGVASLTELRLR